MKTTPIKFITRAAVVLLLTLFSASSALAAGENTMCVVIHETEGTTAFALDARPIISFQDADVQLQCGELTVLYPLDKYLKLTIEESSLTGMKEPRRLESFRVSGSSITASGVGQLALYTSDGKCVATAKADADGVATLSTANLRTGVYVVGYGNKSFKVSIHK